MKTVFEEYGRGILAALAAVLLLGVIFGGIALFKTMGTGVNTDTDFNHAQSEAAVKDFYERGKPVISVPDTTKLHLHLGQDEVFRPNATVSCVDKNGDAVETTVSSIVFIQESGATTELTDKYIAATDEFHLAGNISQPGVLVVSFTAVDRYNVSVSETVSYVVDSAVNG